MGKTLKTLLIPLIVIALTAGAWLTLKVLNERKIDKDYSDAEQWLKEGQNDYALAVIQKHHDAFSDKEGQDKWLMLYIKALEEDSDYSQLLGKLYSSYPKAFEKADEKASLAVASEMIANRRYDAYYDIKAHWSEKTQYPELWFALDGDILSSKGQRKLAEEWLKTQSFEGTKDTPRLIRLALLEMGSQPEEAWNHLQTAIKKDPSNPDLHSIAGALLENVNKISLARNEYLNALKLDEKNPKLYNQLAEFYLRQGQMSLALMSWNAAIEFPRSDKLWIKLLFWSKVLRPAEFSFDKIEPKNDAYKPLIDYLLSLPKDVFWDDAKWAKISQQALYLTTFQETFWLRLLQALKDKNLTHAKELIAFNGFRKQSYRPDLEIATVLAINYQTNHEISLEEPFRSDLLVPPSPILQIWTPPHQLFQELSSLLKNPDQEIDPALKKLLLSSEIFQAIFAAGGWYEAGLYLNPLKTIPKDYPSWLPYTITQALRIVRGNEEALLFAKEQPSSDELNYLIGEMQFALGDTKLAEESLLKIKDKNGAMGFKAAWALARLYKANKQTDKALAIINSNEMLLQNPVGKEIKASIALSQGNKEEATQIYSQIANQSFEAKAFLADEAFKAKKYEDAKSWVRDLLLEFPDNPQYQQMWRQIELEESNKNKPSSQK